MRTLVNRNNNISNPGYGEIGEGTVGKDFKGEEYEEQNSEEVQYEDKYCTLTTNSLVIKNYYFPVCSNKVIPLDNIEIIGSVRGLGVEPLYETKGWGMAFSDIWWALDFGRHMPLSDTFNHSCVVVKVRDDSIRKGFTVLEPGKLFPLLWKRFHDKISTRFHEDELNKIEDDEGK